MALVQVSQLPPATTILSQYSVQVQAGDGGSNLRLPVSSIAALVTAAGIALAAAGGTISSGTALFTNANNVTFGAAGSQITASASFAQSTQPGIQSVSAGTTRVTTGEMVMGDANGVTFGAAGQTITASVRTDYAGTGVTTAGTNVSLSGTLNSNGLSIQASAADPALKAGTGFTSAGNNIGLSGTLNTAGLSLSATAAAQTNQTVGLYASSQTTGQSSSTTVDARSLTVRGAGQVSVGYSAGELIVSATTAAQTAESNTLGISNLGNTAGTSGVVSGNQVRVLFAGGNNVTLSQSLNGASATITVSAANQTVQTQNLHNVTLSGNTAGVLSQISSGTLTLAGGNNVTLSQAGNAVTISGPNTVAQTNQTVGIYASSNTTGQSSSSTYDARSITFRGAGIASIGNSGGEVIISVPSGGGAAFSAGVSTGGNTAGSTGVTGTRLVLAGGNNITLSQSTDANGGTVTVSAFNQSSVAQSIGVSNLGNTSGTTDVRTGAALQIVFAGGNNITLSQSAFGNTAASITISGPNMFNAGVSTGGNTAGNTGTRSDQLVLVGSNNITLSQTTGAGGATVSIVGPTQSNQQMTLFATGNTTLSSTGTTNASSVIFRGSGVASVGITNGSILIDVPAGGGAGFSAGVSTGGNTAGATGITGTRLVLVGSNNITLSQTTGAGGATVTVLGNQVIASEVNLFQSVSVTRGALSDFTRSQHFFGFSIDKSAQFDRLVFPAFWSGASNSTLTASLSVSFGFFTKSGSTLSSLHSTSQTFSVNHSGTVNTSLFNGIRLFTIPWTSTLSSGQYWAAMIFNSATAGAQGTFSIYSALIPFTGALSGAFGVNGTNVHYQLGRGYFNGTNVTFRTSAAFSNILGSAGERPPYWYVTSGTGI